MNQVIWVAVGGAIGSVSRYLLGILLKWAVPAPFPLSTLLINILGSFFIGYLYSSYQHHDSFPIIKPLLIIGVLGGFTTFSSFSFEVVELLENKQMQKALLYVLFSNVFGISAAYWGYKLFS